MCSQCIDNWQATAEVICILECTSVANCEHCAISYDFYKEGELSVDLNNF